MVEVKLSIHNDNALSPEARKQLCVLVPTVVWEGMERKIHTCATLQKRFTIFVRLSRSSHLMSTYISALWWVGLCKLLRSWPFLSKYVIPMGSMHIDGYAALWDRNTVQLLCVFLISTPWNKWKYVYRMVLKYVQILSNECEVLTCRTP